MDSIITQHAGRAFNLPGNDIDTDRIIPARYLKCVTFDGIEAHVFEDDRAAAKGNHPFDKRSSQGASILVVDDNFGCGSSREHAPQALKRWGIKALIGRSFANIFRGNCTANGVICVEVHEDVHRHLVWEIKNGSADVEVDLGQMKVRFNAGASDITMPDADRDMLTTGCWDQIATLLDATPDVEKVARRLEYFKRRAG